MSWQLRIFGHHDDPAHNAADSTSIRDALQRFVDDLRGAGHQLTQAPLLNEQSVSVDTARPLTGSTTMPEPAPEVVAQPELTGDVEPPTEGAPTNG